MSEKIENNEKQSWKIWKIFKINFTKKKKNGKYLEAKNGWQKFNKKKRNKEKCQQFK